MRGQQIPPKGCALLYRQSVQKSFGKDASIRAPPAFDVNLGDGMSIVHHREADAPCAVRHPLILATDVTGCGYTPSHFSAILTGSLARSIGMLSCSVAPSKKTASTPLGVGRNSNFFEPASRRRVESTQMGRTRTRLR